LLQSQNEDYTCIGNHLRLTDGSLHELMTAVIEKGASFRFRARGFSMFPFIRDRDVITLASLKSVGPGDVVAFRHPHSGKLAVHRILEKKADGFLIKGDNIPEPDGIIPAEDVLAVAVSVERKHRKVGGGIGQTKWLLALLSKRNMLWVFNSRLLLLPFVELLRRLQGVGMYRRAIRNLNLVIQIREAKEVDLGEVSDPMGVINFFNPGTTYFVALLNSRIAGCANLERHSPKEDPYRDYWISGLSVWLPCRGLGLGEALCRRIIAQAKVEGAKELHLLDYPEDRAGINLYKKLGFKPAIIPGLDYQLGIEQERTGRRQIAMRLKVCS
jgi:GNAT superfamily N-acetyltransferase